MKKLTEREEWRAKAKCCVYGSYTVPQGPKLPSGSSSGQSYTIPPSGNRICSYGFVGKRCTFAACKRQGWPIQNKAEYRAAYLKEHKDA